MVITASSIFVEPSLGAQKNDFGRKQRYPEDDEEGNHFFLTKLRLGGNKGVLNVDGLTSDSFRSEHCDGYCIVLLRGPDYRPR